MTDAPLGWGLCVSTLNRVAALVLCVRLALVQTEPPVEIVIVDASDDWDANRARIAALVAEAGSIPLVYAQADRRSLPAQRNQGVALARADILFMIDDDSLMYADCAARIMAVYRRDRAGAIAAIGAASATAVPVEDLERPLGGFATSALPAAKVSGTAAHRASVEQALTGSKIFRFFWRDVLLMAADRRFVRYDAPPRHANPAGFDPTDHADSYATEFLSGFTITVRRRIALAEPFDDGLVGYASAEDLDASYRFSRHGVNLVVPAARLHHMEAASGRIKRTKATAFGLLNIGYFVRKHSPRPLADGARVALLAIRMLPAEVVKDLGSRRWSLPQVRGVLLAMRHLPQVLTYPRAQLQPWYGNLQRRILQTVG